MANNLRSDGGLWDEARPVYTGPCGSEWPSMWSRKHTKGDKRTSGEITAPGWPDPRTLFDWTPEELEEATDLAYLLVEDTPTSMHGNAISRRIQRCEKELGLT